MNIKTIMKHKVIKSGFWYTFTEFFLKGISFITIPIFTRLLTPADYGIVSLYGTWVAIATILISLDLKSSIARAKYDYEEEYDQFASSIAFLSLILFVIIFSATAMFRTTISRVINLPEVLVILIMVQAYFSFVKSFTLNKLRFQYKYKNVSIIEIASTIVGVLLSIYLITNILTEQLYYGRILGGSSVIILTGIFFLIHLLCKGKVFINKEYWKYALAISVPLISHELSLIVNNQFDRIIIQRYVGDGEAGIYSFAYNVSMIVDVVRISFAQAVAPWIYEKMKAGEYENIRDKSNHYRNMFTLIYTVVLFISPEIVKLIADPRYWEGLYLMPWIFMAYYFQFMYVEEIRVEIFYKKTGLVSLGTILSAAINVILNLIFIPKYGYPAAAITTAVSFFALFIFHYILTSRVIKHKLYGLKFHLKSLAYVLGTTLMFVLFQETLWIRALFIIAAIGLFVKSLMIKK